MVGRQGEKTFEIHRIATRNMWWVFLQRNIKYFHKYSVFLLSSLWSMSPFLLPIPLPHFTSYYYSQCPRMEMLICCRLRDLMWRRMLWGCCLHGLGSSEMLSALIHQGWENLLMRYMISSVGVGELTAMFFVCIWVFTVWWQHLRRPNS